jgi:hypothetical protein
MADPNLIIEKIERRSTDSIRQYFFTTKDPREIILNEIT